MVPCVRSYLVIYCSKVDIVLDDYFEKNHEHAEQVKQICREILPKLSKEEYSKLIADLSELGLYTKFSTYRESLQNQGKYLNNIVQMIEGLLLTLRSSRQQLWHLKLSSREIFCKYYFALDLLNYARMTPVELYLSLTTTLSTRQKDRSWL